MVAPWKVTLQCRWIVTMSSVRPMGSRGGGDKDEEREEKGGGWIENGILKLNLNYLTAVQLVLSQVITPSCIHIVDLGIASYEKDT